jgi:hypothetical protein
MASCSTTLLSFLSPCHHTQISIFGRLGGNHYRITLLTLLAPGTILSVFVSCSYVQIEWPVEVRALLDSLLIGLIDINAGTLPIINRGGASMPSTLTAIVYSGEI